MSDVRVSMAAPAGMVTLKADLAEPAVARPLGTLPGTRKARSDGYRTILWMAPDEVLILCPREDVGETLARIAEAMGERHHLAADVSDARVQFILEGAGLRDVLAKLTPADLHPDAFGPGEVRRTRLAQVAAALWLTDEGTARLLAFRSVAAYVRTLLETAAAPEATVGYF